METLLDALRRDFPEAVMRENEPMSRHTTFRIGGPVSAMFFPRGEEEAARLLALCAQRGIRPLILGNGSNLLCSDAPMALTVINMRGLCAVAPAGGGELRAGAGALLRQAAEAAAARSLTGLEFAHGIPGTVGGGAFMNAGAYGGELGNVLQSVRVASSDGAVREEPAAALDLSYRHSALEESGDTVLSALFRLEEGEESTIRRRMEELRQKRVEKQPLDRPSAGSTFKRPAGGYSAAMIDGAGLKGYGFGGAAVSEKHAGFVVNLGGATCEDVLKTMRGVRERVFEVYGVMLEPEVRLVGVAL